MANISFGTDGFRGILDKDFNFENVETIVKACAKYIIENKDTLIDLVKQFIEYITSEEAKEQFVTDDWHLAKRQITWFKRNKQIEWLPLEKIKSYVLKCIQNE